MATPYVNANRKSNRLSDSRRRVVVYRKLILRAAITRVNVSGHILASGLGQVEVVRPVVSLRPNRLRCQVSQELNESRYSRLWNGRLGPVAVARDLSNIDYASCRIFHRFIKYRSIHYKVIIFYFYLITMFLRIIRTAEVYFSEFFFIKPLHYDF